MSEVVYRIITSAPSAVVGGPGDWATVRLVAAKVDEDTQSALMQVRFRGVRHACRMTTMDTKLTPRLGTQLARNAPLD